MQIQVFRISVAAEEWQIEDVNRFLASHKIVNVSKRFVDAGENSFWSLLVRYTSEKGASPQTTEKRIDYKEVLNPEDFALFSQLRHVRKELAEKEGVPLYAPFTNEQLADIVTMRVSSLAELANIKGVGKAKVDKYGAAILKCMPKSASKNEEPDDGQETLGEP